MQDASVLQGCNAQLVEMTLEAAKAIADKPRPSRNPTSRPTFSDFLFDLIISEHIILILIHLTQIDAEPRIIVFEHMVWTILLGHGFCWSLPVLRLRHLRVVASQGIHLSTNTRRERFQNSTKRSWPQTGAAASATKHGPRGRPHTVGRLRSTRKTPRSV